MRLSVIGASAGVGLEAAKLAISRGHEVTTLSRRPIESIDPNKHIHLIGDANNKNDLQKVLSTADSFIVALGTGKNLKPTNLCAEFAKLLMQINHENKIKIPAIILSGFGAGDSAMYQPFLNKLFFKLFLKNIYADKNRMETIVEHSDLNWVVARPGILNDKHTNDDYRVETRLYKGINIGPISRLQVADFLVKQAEQPTYSRQYCSLSAK